MAVNDDEGSRRGKIPFRANLSQSNVTEESKQGGRADVEEGKPNAKFVCQQKSGSARVFVGRFVLDTLRSHSLLLSPHASSNG